MSRGGLAVALVFASVVAACESRPDPGARAGAERGRYRRTHREYDGAPPVVPHAVASLNRQDCLNCHREGVDLGGQGMAPTTPHPERVQCLQCHVEQLDAVVRVKNGFAGARWPATGTRAYPGAPPTMPHPRQGRETCLGCHGDNGGSPIRTPHADRVNCLQCHVESVPGAGVYRANDFGGRR